MSGYSNFLDKYTVLLQQHDAPGIHNALQGCAEFGGKKFHVDEVRLVPYGVAMDQENLHHAADIFSANMIRQGDKKILLVGEGLCEAMGSHYGSHHLTSELKAIIGHEVGHLQHARGYLLPGLGSIAFGLAAGLGAVYIARRLMGQSHEPDEVKKTLENAKAASEEQTGNKLTAASAAIYLGGALLGVGVTVLGMKQLNHRLELSADAFSAKWLKNSQPMQNVFVKLDEMFGKQFEFNFKGRRAFAVPEKVKGKTASEIAEGVGSAGKIQTFFESFMGSLTHPKDQTRISKLQGMAL